jgi:high-affinity iron transporter
MFANFLIGLREGLEASLVVGILIAYLVRTERRHLLSKAWIGVGIAVVVSLVFGAILTLGPQGLSFEAQEAIGGTLSIVAVGLITWMIFWMGKNARFLKRELEGSMERAISVGSGAVITMALLAVGREGLETALFLWAGIQSSGSTAGPVIGATLGLAAAVLLGVLIYRGALHLNLRIFFQWTGVFLVIVAAGVLAYGVHDLQEAGILPGLNNLAWDVSATIGPSTVLGTFLKAIFNFSPATTVLQAVAYFAYLIPVMILFVRQAFGAPKPRPDAVVSPASDLAQEDAPQSA